MKELHDILIRPLITEKSTTQKETHNEIAFVVNPKANKVEVWRAVEKAFNVKVLSVRTMRMIGKKKRVGRFPGKKPDWKKALVKLAPGDHIDFFEGA
ncbi:MAG: 50S ribosomal protein L23 [Deltaproteobacteria bacterium]|nr:50S ribosomal protein L23 [Deltaproteobacteria bacterium]